jgi:ADP-ribosylglycohydrolase
MNDRLTGVILGTAVGDALGLPREGLSPRRSRRLFGDPPLRHRFLFGQGMTSDDTEHTCMLAQALVRYPNTPDRFARSLAWKLRWWLLGVPAGVGKATLLGTLRLWLGFSPSSSGIYSAGNGPAMRSALLGVCLGQHHDQLTAYVRASTRLTHTDPRAERGALLVALGAHLGATVGPAGVSLDAYRRLLQERNVQTDEELEKLLALLEDHLRQRNPARIFIDAVGLKKGVTGYVYHTVPAALYCWLRHPGDFRAAVEEVILLGGDADTTGAITGALAGATVGCAGIPAEWVEGLLEWPRSVRWMRTLADRLALVFRGEPAEAHSPVPLFWPGVLPRNLFFFLIVLGHLVRRCLPPY